jgi:putative ABC transport system ATP-binding protein
VTIVECIDVSKTYHTGRIEVPALKGVSLSVEKGGFLALAGPSGSGKTTMLNIIGGLDAADSGTVLLDGDRLGDMDQSELAGLRLRKVGFVFQSYNLIPVLTALENVEFVMLLQGVKAHERQSRAMDILDEVGLGGMHDRRPSALSGGQQQRVAVARAIVSNPSIVLADEPTANLDSETGKGLLDIMKGMNERRGVTFIFSTHDQMVMDYAKRVIQLKDGQIADDRIKIA